MKLRHVQGMVLLLAAPLVTLAAEPGIPALAVQTGGSGQTYTLTIQLLALMTAITLLPAALLMMTRVSCERLLRQFCTYSPDRTGIMKSTTASGTG